MSKSDEQLNKPPADPVWPVVLTMGCFVHVRALTDTGADPKYSASWEERVTKVARTYVEVVDIHDARSKRRVMDPGFIIVLPGSRGGAFDTVWSPFRRTANTERDLRH